MKPNRRVQLATGTTIEMKEYIEARSLMSGQTQSRIIEDLLVKGMMVERVIGALETIAGGTRANSARSKHRRMKV